MAGSPDLRASAPPAPLARGERPARGALGLLAVIAGVSVANLYYAQPLAAMMASSLGVGASGMGLALMLCQVGYALGMLLLVPLGDGRERRGLMLKTALAASGTLLLVAAAPNFPALAASSLLLGFASCLPQMALPFAVGLVPLAERGQAIGWVMGGLLTGILLSRTASGTLAAVVGWRATFACAAGLMLATAIALRAALPRQEPEQPLEWATIVRSLAGVVRGQPVLRRHSLVGACGFASFSVFWSTLSFHLERLGHGSGMAGMFGVIGVAGIVAAPIVGRLSGKVRPTRINAVGLVAVMLGFAVFAGGGASLVALGIGVVLLDAGVQASHLSNQTIIFGLDPALRNRINAVYMVSYFIGGAAGTIAAAATWERWGWAGVCLLGAAFSGAGLVPLSSRFAGARAHEARREPARD
jgi:predicted MFS family arabinose efflux permease